MVSYQPGSASQRLPVFVWRASFTPVLSAEDGHGAAVDDGGHQLVFSTPDRAAASSRAILGSPSTSGSAQKVNNAAMLVCHPVSSDRPASGCSTSGGCGRSFDNAERRGGSWDERHRRWWSTHPIGDVLGRDIPAVTQPEIFPMSMMSPGDFPRPPGLSLPGWRPIWRDGDSLAVPDTHRGGGLNAPPRCDARRGRRPGPRC